MRHGLLRKTIVTLSVVATLVVGSFAAADAATSYHGSDYSQDYNSLLNLRACDVEADSNIVKGGWSNSVGGGETGSVTDGDGANGVCATLSTGGVWIRRHHTCEKNLFSWDCGNWQAT